MIKKVEAKDQYIVPNFVSQLSDLVWAWFYYFYNSADLHSNHLQRASMPNCTLLHSSAAELKIHE